MVHALSSFFIWLLYVVFKDAVGHISTSKGLFNGPFIPNLDPLFTTNDAMYLLASKDNVCMKIVIGIHQWNEFLMIFHSYLTIMLLFISADAKHLLTL